MVNTSSSIWYSEILNKYIQPHGEYKELDTVLVPLGSRLLWWKDTSKAIRALDRYLITGTLIGGYEHHSGIYTTMENVYGLLSHSVVHLNYVYCKFYDRPTFIPKLKSEIVCYVYIPVIKKKY